MKMDGVYNAKVGKEVTSPCGKRKSTSPNGKEKMASKPNNVYDSSCISLGAVVGVRSLIYLS